MSFQQARLSSTWGICQANLALDNLCHSLPDTQVNHAMLYLIHVFSADTK